MAAQLPCPMCGRIVARRKVAGGTALHGKWRVRHKCPHGKWCAQGDRNWGSHSNGRPPPSQSCCGRGHAYEPVVGDAKANAVADAFVGPPIDSLTSRAYAEPVSRFDLPNNCAIRERTGDGVSVGRCMFFAPGDVCPRHGDVSAVMVTYRMTGKLTDEQHSEPGPSRLSARFRIGGGDPTLTERARAVLAGLDVESSYAMGRMDEDFASERIHGATNCRVLARLGVLTRDGADATLYAVDTALRREVARLLTEEAGRHG